jgi:hypothetical protein
MTTLEVVADTNVADTNVADTNVADTNAGSLENASMSERGRHQSYNNIVLSAMSASSSAPRLIQPCCVTIDVAEHETVRVWCCARHKDVLMITRSSADPQRPEHERVFQSADTLFAWGRCLSNLSLE